MDQEKCHLTADPHDCQRCQSMALALMEQGEMDEEDMAWVKAALKKLEESQGLYQHEVDRLDELWTGYGMGER